MINQMSLKNGCVLVENPRPCDKSLFSGIFIPAHVNQDSFFVSVVVAAAPDCEVKPGDKVLFSRGLKETIDDSEHGAKYLIIREQENVYGTVPD